MYVYKNIYFYVHIVYKIRIFKKIKYIILAEAKISSKQLNMAL